MRGLYRFFNNNKLLLVEREREIAHRHRQIVGSSTPQHRIHVPRTASAGQTPSMLVRPTGRRGGQIAEFRRRHKQKREK